MEPYRVLVYNFGVCWTYVGLSYGTKKYIYRCLQNLYLKAALKYFKFTVLNIC